MTSDIPRGGSTETGAPETRSRSRSGRATGRSSRPRSQRPSGREAGRRSARGGGDRRAWWIAAIAVVVLGCALLTCGALAGSGLLGFGRPSTEQAMRSADGHWQKATVSMERAATSLSGLKPAVGPATSAAVAAAAAEASAAIGSAQVELKAAGEAVAALPDSALRTSYRGAIAAAEAALVDLDVMLAALETANRLYGLAATGAEHVRVGTAHLAAAIVATNSDRYPDVHREAQAATQAFAEARKSFEAGQDIDPKAGFDKALAYNAKLSGEAALLNQLADAGAAKQIPRYNVLAAAQAKTQKELAALAQPAIIANRQAVIATVDKQRALVRQHLDQAEKLYKQAQAEYKKTAR